MVVAATHLDHAATWTCRCGLVDVVSGAGAGGLSQWKPPRGRMTKPEPLQRLDQGLFDRVAQSARQASRLRMNHNLHKADDLVQRFINVLQPGTYVRPHRHLRDNSGEGFGAFSSFREPWAVVRHGQVTLLERLDASGPGHRTGGEPGAQRPGG